MATATPGTLEPVPLAEYASALKVSADAEIIAFPRLRIVALGDSLTRGYQPAGRMEPLFCETPYTEFLALRCGDAVEFVNRGVNGDLTSGMVERFESDVLKEGPDHLILLGGANDIGWGAPVSDVFANLTVMLRRARGAGIDACACTVPPVRGWDDGNRLRLKLNAALAEYCATEAVTWVDLYSPLADGPGGDLRREFSGDGLHLTTAGYRAMADAIWDGFVSRLV